MPIESINNDAGNAPPGSRTVLITGGTGFVGAYTIKNLVEKGYRVRAIKRSAKLPFYIPLEIFNKVEWYECDLLDIVALGDAMSNVDAIVHSAAIVSFSAHNRDEMYKVNIEGTANVVNAALEQGVKRLIHVSSVAALGRTASGETVNEEKKWAASKINTNYAITKHHAEMHVWRAFEEGLSGVVLNPSTVLGFGDWHQSSCAIFKNVYNDFPWYTEGINGFVGVEDVAEVIARLVDSDIVSKRYIVNAENWSFKQLLAEIAEGFNKRPPYRHANKFMGEIAWRLEKAKALIGGKRPLLTKETAKVAHSKTYFDNRALLEALPGFTFTPLEEVVSKACSQYIAAVRNGSLTP